MAIVATASKPFVPCPAGLTQAVCVDIFDLGVIETTFNGHTKLAHKVDVFWESAEVNPENDKPFLVRKRYTLSLDPKANLRKDLESWRGKAFTEEEKKGFDLERLLGANAQLNIAHIERDGTVYANVTAIVPLSKGQAKIAPSMGFVRKKDRVEAPQNGHADAPDEDDSIPFAWLAPLATAVLTAGLYFC